MGWLVFAIIEALLNTTRTPALRCSTVLLTITAYAIAGAVGGMIIACMQHFLGRSRRDSQNIFGAEIACYSGCIASILLCAGLAIIKNKLFVKAQLPAVISLSLLFCVLCAGMYLLLVRLLSGISSRETLRRVFCALFISLCALLLAGIFINEVLLPGKFLDLTPKRLLVNGAIIVGCCALFFVIFWLLKVSDKFLSILSLPGAASYFLLLSGVVAWGVLALALKTNTDNIIKEFATILTQRPSIILISIDTMRADHLSCYGYKRNTTPHIDQLARESLVLKRAYAPSSWTLPSHASIMTGCYPSMHNAHRAEHTGPPYYCTKLSDDNVTIAEILTEHGYDTAGIIAGTFCKAFFGLGQGFNVYDDNLDPFGGERKAHETNELAFAWLNNRETQFAQQKFLLFNFTLPVFLFIHYFDPHQCYMPPAPFDTRYPGRDDAVINAYTVASAASYKEKELELLMDVIKRKHELSLKEKNHLLSLYDGELSFVDDAVGKLLEKLRELKLFTKSMIIVTSDHGESFGEHHLMIHGIALYDDNLRVPLIIKYPAGCKKTGVVNEPVSLVDIFPEILSTVSIPVPENIQGTALQSPEKSRTIIAENFQDPTWKKRQDLKHLARDLKAIYSGDFKYLWASDGRCELYNVSDDPLESANLIDKLPGKAQELNALLERWSSSFTPIEGDKDLPDADQAITDKLRALGYIE
jgi:arylsulfatase